MRYEHERRCEDVDAQEEQNHLGVRERDRDVVDLVHAIEPVDQALEVLVHCEELHVRNVLRAIFVPDVPRKHGYRDQRPSLF